MRKPRAVPRVLRALKPIDAAGFGCALAYGVLSWSALLWLLLFAVIRPSAWAWTASVAVLLSYVTGLNLDNLQMEPFGHPFWVRPVEYGLIALALLYDVRRRARVDGDGCTADRAEGR